MKMEKEKSTGSSSTRIKSTSSSLEMWICSLPQVSMYLHNLSPRWPWNIHMQSVASLEHQDQYLWIQIPTAHQKFLRVWIEVCEMVRKVRSIFTCSKYLRKTKFRPCWICNLIIVIIRVMLSWFLSYFFLFHLLQLIPGQGNAGRGKGTVRGEPWQACSNASAKSPTLSGPQCEDSQGKLTLRHKLMQPPNWK